MATCFCQNITIPCDAGHLEGRLHYTEENQNNAGVILCPPHPLLAGNMDNNVIMALSEALAPHFSVLSFNYRNVGQSFKPDGDLPLFEYWHRLDQANDFSAIIHDTTNLLNWSKRFFTTFHLVGYSFGSFIALATQHKAMQSYTAISPPTGEHGFDFSPLSCPSFFVFAEQDSLTQNKSTIPLPSHASSKTIHSADHFFLNYEQDVAKIVLANLLGDTESLDAID